MPESDPIITHATPTTITGARLSHLDERGEARMVDVSAKPALFREAVACGEILVSSTTLDLMESDRMAKGNVLATARIAGIQAAKRTGELIPIDARRVATFHASHKLKALIQGDTVDDEGVETLGR